MTKKYKITADADMLAPKWLASKINYKSIKFLYHTIDGVAKLKGMRIENAVAKIGDAVLFEGKQLSVERR